jgi:hypothetical protein
MPHDKNGQLLQVGDTVILPCRITAVHEGETACNVTAEALLRPEGEAYIPTIAGNSKFYEKTNARVRSGDFCPIKDTKQFRKDLDAVLSELKQASSPHFNEFAAEGVSYPPGYRNSPERSIAITKIQEAIMWLGMDLKAINEEQPGAAPNPYPESYNPDSKVIEPTADGLKL